MAAICFSSDTSLGDEEEEDSVVFFRLLFVPTHTSMSVYLFPKAHQPYTFFCTLGINIAQLLSEDVFTFTCVCGAVASRERCSTAMWRADIHRVQRILKAWERKKNVCDLVDE